MSENALKPWQELELGTTVAEPGSASRLKTGDWKTLHPVVDEEKCIKCTLCGMYCPEFCIAENEEGYWHADLYYCKGCGICANECPKDAITMKLEDD